MWPIVAIKRKSHVRPRSTSSMISLISFLVLSSFFHNAISTSSIDSSNKRKPLSFSDETKWDCFYRTTLPVNDLDSILFRQDEYGNLLMAGLSYCQGCLCYNFDHRYPISSIPDNIKPPMTVIAEMNSIYNCQAMSVRTNSLKGSIQESEIVNVVGRFGCDAGTMSLFTENNYAGLKAIQNQLIDSERYNTIKSHHSHYVNGSYKINARSPVHHFDILRNSASALVTRVQNILARI